MVVRKEEVASSRWLREEMALKTWGPEKQSKAVKKGTGRMEDGDATSLHPNLYFYSLNDLFCELHLG